jgi:hypothetical protein
MAFELPAIESLLKVDVTLVEEDVYSLEVVDPAVALKFFPDFGPDYGRRDIERVYCADLRCSSVPVAIERAGPRSGNRPGSWRVNSKRDHQQPQASYPPELWAARASLEGIVIAGMAR